MERVVWKTSGIVLLLACLTLFQAQKVARADYRKADHGAIMIVKVQAQPDRIRYIIDGPDGSSGVLSGHTDRTPLCAVNGGVFRSWGTLQWQAPGDYAVILKSMDGTVLDRETLHVRAGECDAITF